MYQSIYAPLWYRADVMELEPVFDEMKRSLLYLEDQEIAQAWSASCSFTVPPCLTGMGLAGFPEGVHCKKVLLPDALMLIRQIIYSLEMSKAQSEKYWYERHATEEERKAYDAEQELKPYRRIEVEEGEQGG